MNYSHLPSPDKQSRRSDVSNRNVAIKRGFEIFDSRLWKLWDQKLFESKGLHSNGNPETIRCTIIRTLLFVNRALK